MGSPASSSAWSFLVLTKRFVYVAEPDGLIRTEWIFCDDHDDDDDDDDDDENESKKDKRGEPSIISFWQIDKKERTTNHI